MLAESEQVYYIFPLWFLRLQDKIVLKIKTRCHVF